MNRLLLLFALFASPVLAAERQVMNPDTNGNLVFRVYNGSTIDALTIAGATGMVSIPGGLKQTVCSKSADYTVTDSDGCYVVAFTTGASTRTLTLPSAANNSGRRLMVTKVDAGAGLLTIGGTISGYTINNSIVFQWGWAIVVSNGSTWQYEKDISDAGTVSATYSIGIFTGGNSQTQTLRVRREGAVVTVFFTGFSATVSASSGQFVTSNGAQPLENWVPLVGNAFAAIGTSSSVNKAAFITIDEAGSGTPGRIRVSPNSVDATAACVNNCGMPGNYISYQIR